MELEKLSPTHGVCSLPDVQYGVNLHLILVVSEITYILIMDDFRFYMVRKEERQLLCFFHL